MYASVRLLAAWHQSFAIEPIGLDRVAQALVAGVEHADLQVAEADSWRLSLPVVQRKVRGAAAQRGGGAAAQAVGD
ncbi:MAG: hypothetical protein F9K31_02430, partial [Dokdonella sp.]